MKEKKEKISQITKQLLEKIKTDIDSALAFILNKNEIIQQPLIQRKFVTRRTDDLLPAQKQVQNQQFPLQSALSFDTYIVGVKNYPG